MKNPSDKIVHPIMFVGTGSDVGKSVLTAGICRILLQDGYSPVPFKSQNMSLNSYVTEAGGEIGRAQAVQAEACRLNCHTDMNPVLLKPNSDKSSQVIVNGKVFGNYSASSYFRGDIKEELLTKALEAFHRLNRKYHPVVIEGAGSISEINLKKNDIANMRIAVETNASTFLVADIERGGVFGSVYGSLKLLPEPEHNQMKGIIINKFRGDIGLFDEGKSELERLTGLPVIGIVPYFNNIFIEEEDSVSLQKKFNKIDKDKINIAVVQLKRISNFTDFNRLEQDPRVNLIYSRDASVLEKSDIIILPGTKNTISDLIDLKNSGIAEIIARQARIGKTVIGICGGYQMMGQLINDPYKVESNIGPVSGLGILPLETCLNKEKLTVQTEFRFKDYSDACFGYEIHMGETNTTSSQGFSLLSTTDNSKEGFILRDNCWGTYMHGILDNPVVIEDLLKPFDKGKQEAIDYDTFKQKQYDLLAGHLRKNLNMDLFYKAVI